MERSLFATVLWVDLQMAVIWVLAMVGLLAVTVRLARDTEPPRSQHASAGQGSQRPIEPLTPEWLERLITGVGHPPTPRPRPAEPDAGAREVA